MARRINFDERWHRVLDSACGGSHYLVMETMDQQQQVETYCIAFREYLAECYADHVKQELGPALAPYSPVEALRLKAALLHHWKTSDIQDMDRDTLVNALAGELSTFKLSEEAYSVVSFFEDSFLRDPFGKEIELKEMVTRHRPDHLADR